MNFAAKPTGRFSPGFVAGIQTPCARAGGCTRASTTPSRERTGTSAKEHAMTVEKKDLDWGNLDFSYRKTDYSYVSNYKDGA